MTPDHVDTILRTFRRQMWLAELLRWAIVSGAVCAMALSYFSNPDLQRWSVIVLIVVLVLWVAIGLRAVGMVQSARQGAAMLATGRVQEARDTLGEALRRFTPSRSVKILACHQFAVAAHMQRQYRDAAQICRTILSHRLGVMSSVGNPTRLILADSLLSIGEAQAAGPVIEALSSKELSLSDRLMLLPIALRHQLATHRPAEALADLDEKIRLADMLQSRTCCLVHLLLAEACARTGQPGRHQYLYSRAALLADVDSVLDEHRQPGLTQTAQSEHGTTGGESNPTFSPTTGDGPLA